MSFISAQPPFQQSDTSVGLQIESGIPTSVKINDDYYLHAHVYEASTGLIVKDANCSYHFYNHQIDGGVHISMGEMEQYGEGYNVTIDGSLINESGEYSALIWCTDNAGVEGGFFRYTFDASEGGVEITEGRSILAVGLLAVLVLLMFVSLYGLFGIESVGGKFALYWVTHILAILVCFTGWQLGVEGLLDVTALTGVFRILFYVLTVSVFPMVILSLVWIFYIHTFNEHFEKLIEKGNDPEQAFALSKRKTKGWLHGK